MRGWTKQKRHLRMIRSLKHPKDNDYHIEIDKIDSSSNCDLVNTTPKPIECAFATLVSGNSFTSASEYSRQMNQKFTSKASFYKAQKIVANAVEEYSNVSMTNALNSSVENSIFSGDGRYPIRRNASHCSFDIINTDTNKVVALGIVDKKSFHHPEEDFQLTSNMMETEAMKRALNQITPSKNKIGAFVIDGDNKNRNLLEQEEINIIRDPNHLILSFNKYLDKELKEYKKMIPGINDCFRGIREKIKKWYGNLVFMNLDSVTKKAAWLNTVEHLRGNHRFCLIHKETKFAWIAGLFNDEAAAKLFQIQEKRMNDFDLTVRNATTNFIEAFHQEQLKFGTKSTVFPISQITRDHLAVLNHNEGPMFILELRKRLGLPELMFNNDIKIQQIHDDRKKTLETRKTLEYRMKNKQYRKAKKESNRKIKKGDYRSSSNSPDPSESFE